MKLKGPGIHNMEHNDGQRGRPPSLAARLLLLTTAILVSTLASGGGNIPFLIFALPPTAAGTDFTPSAFLFDDLTNIALSTATDSNIIQITGIDNGVDVSLTGGISGQYRICSSYNCGVEVLTWTNSPSVGLLTNGNFLQIRQTSSNTNYVTTSLTVNVGTASSTWNIQTVPAAGQPAVTVSFTSISQTVPEVQTTYPFTLALSATSLLTVTVPYTVYGTATATVDYTLASGTFTIPAGSISISPSLIVWHDVVAEETESVVIVLGTPTNAHVGAINSHTVYIADNEATCTTSYNLTASSSSTCLTGSFFDSGGSGSNYAINQNFNYTINPFAAESISLLISTFDSRGGSDFLNIFNISGAGTDLDNYTSGGTGYNGLGLTNLAPNPATGGSMYITWVSAGGGGVKAGWQSTWSTVQRRVEFTSAAQFVDESVGAVTVTAQLTSVATANVVVPFTVAGTAANPADHDLAAGSITITAGNLTGSTTFNVVSDSTVEYDETVVVTLGAVTSGPAILKPDGRLVKTITIDENDFGSGFRFAITDPGVQATNVPFTVTVQVVDDHNNLVTTHNSDVRLDAVPSSNVTGDGVLVDIVNGIGTITLMGSNNETVILQLADTQGTGLDVNSRVTVPILGAAGFITTIGGISQENIYDIAQTADGGYIAVGSAVGQAWDGLLIKMDAAGVEQWSRIIGDSDSEHFYAVVVVSDGYVAFGRTEAAGSWDGIVSKFDLNGVELWTRTFGSATQDLINDAVATSDGGFVVVGRSPTTNSDGFIAKMNSDGTIVWNSQVNILAEEFYSVKQTSDGGYIAAGKSDISSDIQALLVKFNSSGVEQWSKLIGSASQDQFQSVIELSGGGYVAVGFSLGLGAGGLEAMISRFDASGVEQWTKTVGGTLNETFMSVLQTADGGFLAAGYTGDFGAASVDGLLVKFSSSGVEEWTRLAGGAVDEYIYSLISTSDGGYMAAGVSSSTPSGLNHGYFVKLDSNGNIPNGCGTLVSPSVTEANQTLTEANQTLTETASWTTTTVQAFTESIYSTHEAVVCSGGNVADSTPSVFDFTDLYSVAFNTPTLSNIVQVVAMDSGTAISLSGSGSPEYRICANWDCSSIDVNWTTGAGTISPSKYVQLKLTSGGTQSVTSTATLTVGTLAVTWSVTTTPVTFAKILGGAGNEDFYDIKATSDGGYVVVGSSGFGAGSVDGILIKYNSSGVEQWSKTVGGTNSDGFYAVQQTSDGGFIASGSTMSYGGGSQDGFLVKFNSSGVEQWSKSIGGAANESLNSVIEATDGGFIAAGNTATYGAGSSDMLVVKFNSSGVEQWSKTLGGTGVESLSAVIELTDGSIVAAGATTSYGSGSNDGYLVKLNSSGVEQWSKTLGSTGSDMINGLIKTSGGNFLAVGETTSYGAGGSDALLVSFNSSGVVQWSKTLGGAGNDVFKTISETSNGGFIATGITASYGAGTQDGFLVKFNSSGAEQWSKTYGGTANDQFYAGFQAADGGFIVAGLTWSYGAGGSDGLLVKFNTSGDVYGTCTQAATQTLTEVNQSLTAPDLSITEANQTLTEGNITLTESDQTSSTTENVLCTGI
jgi:hypothetical protein